MGKRNKEPPKRKRKINNLKEKKSKVSPKKRKFQK